MTRRSVQLLLTLLALMVAAFLIIHLIPGDPARRIAGIDATAQEVTNLRHTLGLDRPLAVQFVAYMSSVLHGNFGNSFITGDPVVTVLTERLPKTAELAAVSLALVMALSVPIGVVVAALTREGRHPRLELVFTVVSSVGGAVPEYLTGTVLAFFFAVWLRWLPVGGAGHWYSVVLPAVAIAIRPIAILSRIVRVEGLNVLAQDYIRTARSKRLPAFVLYARHALPNVSTAALTIGGLIFASLLGGTVIVENVFAWPGLGTEIVQAVQARDYPIVQGVVLLLGAAVVIVNTLVDVVLGIVDPRSLVRQA